MTSFEIARKSIEETDREMAALFINRMRAAKIIADYKKEKNIPVKDEKREKELIEKNSNYVSDEELKPYYDRFLKNVIELSCAYQEELIGEENE